MTLSTDRPARTPARFTYSICGERIGDPPGNLEVFVVKAGTRRRLRHIVRHSPDGFECGYAGSGPADLAYAILVSHFEGAGKGQIRIGDDTPRARAAKLYQRFKFQIVAKLPRAEDWELTGEAVAAWLERQA